MTSALNAQLLAGHEDLVLVLELVPPCLNQDGIRHLAGDFVFCLDGEKSDVELFLGEFALTQCPFHEQVLESSLPVGIGVSAVGSEGHCTSLSFNV